MEFIIEKLVFLSALVGTIYVIAAVITHQFPPKKINHLYGYRTVSSMKTQDRWDFAQRFSTFQMIKAGIMMIFISFVGLFIKLTENENLLLGLFFTISITAWMMYSIETAIKKKFTEK